MAEPVGGRAWPRVIGKVGGPSGASGPVLVALGGIHGNEPAGLIAAERVLARMKAERMAERGLVRGTFVALSGNRAALARGVRFVDRDLNRGWSDDVPAGGGAEDGEQAELRAAIFDAFAAAPRDRRYFVDVHTTSAPGVPFVVADGVEAAQAFALAFPLPVFFGLIGTILGGIWGNESWGRFWGWDPKENGAMLIVLWCLMVLHMRLAGWVKEFGFHIWTAMGAIPVIFSWWHVNLLQVGLHSYGFTEGLESKLRIAYWMVGSIVFLGIFLRVLEGIARRQALAPRRLGHTSAQLVAQGKFRNRISHPLRLHRHVHLCQLRPGA